jgi:hypothetical protein
MGLAARGGPRYSAAECDNSGVGQEGSPRAGKDDGRRVVLKYDAEDAITGEFLPAGTRAVGAVTPAGWRFTTEKIDAFTLKQICQLYPELLGNLVTKINARLTGAATEEIQNMIR